MGAASDKAALRRLLLRRRDSISHEMAQLAGRRIFERVRSLPEFADASAVACYYPTGSEVPTQDIMQEAASRGKAVCLPRVAGGEIELRRVDDLRGLERGGWGGGGMFGIMEPRAACAECPSPDLIIVPAVGVTASGDRLGYGGGYYDRLLARGGGSAPLAAALAFHKQVVGSMPSMEGDVRVGCVVTERGVFRAPAGGAAAERPGRGGRGGRGAAAGRPR